jgi:hypothetical protein
MKHTRLFAHFAFSLALMTGTSFGQLCPPTPTPPGPNEGGAFLQTTSSPTCTLEEGGYVKKQPSGGSAAYRIHFKATVSGSCQTRIPVLVGSSWVCVNYQNQLRDLGTSRIFQGLPTAMANIAAQGSVQHYDTSVPTGTTQTGSNWYATSEGAFTFTSLIKTNATTCNFQPTESPGTPFVANVVKCKPLQGQQFFPPSGDPVQVYVPYSWAYGAFDHAISQWNSAGLGVTMTRVTSPCSGPRCVNVVGGTPPGGHCGWATAASDGSRQITSNATVTIYPEELQYNENRLRRTATHELGHFLDLANYDCASEADAIMEDAFGSCVSSVPVETNLQPSDKLPAQQSAYGSRPWDTCGF